MLVNTNSVDLILVWKASQKYDNFSNVVLFFLKISPIKDKTGYCLITFDQKYIIYEKEKKSMKKRFGFGLLETNRYRNRAIPCKQ